MKTYLTYGAISAVAGLLINVALYLLGAHDNPTKTGVLGVVGFLAILASWVLCIVYGTRARRAQVPPDKDFGYGSAFAAGVLVTVFAAIFGGIGTAIYFMVINPDFSRLLYEHQIAAMEATGRVPPEQALKVMRTMMSPPVMSAFGVLQIMFCGTIISLITAAIQKRPAVPSLTMN